MLLPTKALTHSRYALALNKMDKHEHIHKTENEQIYAVCNLAVTNEKRFEVFPSLNVCSVFMRFE